VLEQRAQRAERDQPGLGVDAAAAGDRRQARDVADAAGDHLGLGLGDDQVGEPCADRAERGLDVVVAEERVAQAIDLRLHVDDEVGVGEQRRPARQALGEQRLPLGGAGAVGGAQHQVRIHRRQRRVEGDRHLLAGDLGPDVVQAREREQEAQVGLVDAVGGAARRLEVEHRGHRRVEVAGEGGAVAVGQRGLEIGAERVAGDVEPEELLDQAGQRALHGLRGLLDLELVGGGQPRRRIGIGELHADAGSGERLVGAPHRFFRLGAGGEAEHPERVLAELAETGRAHDFAIGFHGHPHFTWDRTGPAAFSRWSSGNMRRISRHTSMSSSMFWRWAAYSPRSMALRVTAISPSLIASFLR
jgi:hypothetical protein